MNEDAPRRLHAFVTGRVQGVGFRYYVSDAARRAGVVGWVRNLRDGRVELIAEGAPSELEVLLDQVRRGPPGSRVEHVESAWQDAVGDLSGFRLERTG